MQPTQSPQPVWRLQADVPVGRLRAIITEESIPLGIVAPEAGMSPASGWAQLLDGVAEVSATGDDSGEVPEILRRAATRLAGSPVRIERMD